MVTHWEIIHTTRWATWITSLLIGSLSQMEQRKTIPSLQRTGDKWILMSEILISFIMPLQTKFTYYSKTGFQKNGNSQLLICFMVILSIKQEKLYSKNSLKVGLPSIFPKLLWYIQCEILHRESEKIFETTIIKESEHIISLQCIIEEFLLSIPLRLAGMTGRGFRNRKWTNTLLKRGMRHSLIAYRFNN